MIGFLLLENIRGDTSGSDPEENFGLHIGRLETKGEKGILNISASNMLRLRYNPFYSNMQQQIINFLADTPAN